jgi:mannose-1-phosphate guanylyltransferase
VSLPAVILVGGLGTRLRPLTDRTRKDMLPLVDRPQLAYTFEHLRRFGVTRAIISCGYLPTQIQEHFGDRYGDLRLEYRIEEEPLGTGGAIRFAANGITETFFALNGDSLRETDLGALVDFHRERRGRATILLTPVEDPTRYGLVRVHGDGRVLSFLEKPRPEEIDTNLINAGLYVLEPDVLDLIPPGRPVSIEREIFPQLVNDGLYGFPFDDYWIDIGTPERYLEATYDLLAGRVESELPPRDETASLIYDPSITSGARIGPLSVVGRHCSVGDESVVERAVLHDSVLVGHRCTIEEAIVAEGARIEDGVRIEPDSIVGAGVVVPAGTTVESGARLEPSERVG